jgi:hypothetical protein
MNLTSTNLGAWVLVFVVAGACTVKRDLLSGGESSGSSESSTGGEGAETSTAGSAEATGAPTATTQGDASNGTSDGGDTSDTDPAFTTDEEATGEPIDGYDTEGDDCNGDTWTHVPEGEAEFYDLVNAWDKSGFTPVACPYEDETTPCSEAPVPGLVSALVVRNDALPVPKSFVTGSARWLVWSNTQLACADPMGSPLCAGEWRVSLAVYAEMWCHGVREYPGEHGYGFGGGYPYLIEAGDENCETTAYTIADDDNSSVRIRFADNGVLPPYFEPEKGVEVCAACEVPGAPAVITGTFDAIICPE